MSDPTSTTTTMKKMQQQTEQQQVIEPVMSESAVATPRTTDLDRIIGDTVGDSHGSRVIPVLSASRDPSDTQYPHQDHSERLFQPRTSAINMDREDIETVKYMPLQMNTSTLTPIGYNGRKSEEEEEEEERTSRSYANDVNLRGEQLREIRVVEHLRKNLTLFERESYSSLDSNCPTYANRGHLQSILVKRQPANSRQTQQRTFNQPQQRLLHDQYTQYRASDFVAKPPSRGTNYVPTTLQTDNFQSYNSKGNLNAENQKRSTTNRSGSIKRGVNSLNNLLKKQFDLVSKKQNHQREDLANHLSILQQQQQQESHKDLLDEGHYKLPSQKPSYSTSQSLYLVPVPDSTVHIQTRSVKDIILAYQRAKLKERPRTKSSLRANKLTQFFGSYTLRRSEDQQKRKQTDLKLRHRSRSLSLSRGATRATYSSSTQYSQEPTLESSVCKIKAKVKMPSGRSEKATIVDNKDGTVKIAYEPKEVGQHEISVRYNEEPIDESPIVFYVDAVGSAKKKITAYGAGLVRGVAGEANKFMINTGGLGSAKLNVAVDGPSKAQVNLSDNKDGTITVSYQPLIPGEYSIKVSFDGKQVIGSPFIAHVSDEGRQRSQISVGRGSEHTLDLKISEDDLRSLTAVIVTPSSVEEPCGLKLLKNNQLAIIFTPREQGEHLVSVKRRGNHISGSPFKFDVLSRDIGDAKQVKVSGKGLKEGKTDTENEIIINTKDAGYGGLSVALEGPGKSEIISKDTTDGTIKLSYTPHEPGEYSLAVKYADHVVPGSPFVVKVAGQAVNKQKETIKKFRKQANIADVNTECTFSFKLPGASAYELSARITSPQGNTEDASIKDKGDSVYQVTFIPKEAGLFALSIRQKDIHIAGSPFPFTVGPLVDSGPHKVRVGGTGIIRGTVNKINVIDIITREAGAGELTVVVEGPSKPELTYTDRKDGSCHVGYKVSEAGEYRISVLFNDQEVPESPFRAYLMPLTGEVSKIELGPMPPENMIQLDKPCNLTVIMNGAKGDITGKVRLPSGKFEDCFASPIDAENWGVRFIPRELGIHQVHIKFKKGSSHIPQSPVLIQVGHDKADPAAVMAHGHGLKSAIVNHATDFTIETCNAGHALLEVNIEGPSKVSMGCAELDEGYRVNYTPLAPGDYLISIKYNGCHIGSSPFKVRAIKQPGSRTVADIGSHEISTISLATTDREAKQKVENMPKFKSDASHVYCKGMGLKKAFAGKPNTLTVNCSEAGFNMLYAAFLGPTRNTIHECTVKHMGGSIYEVKYTCKDKGDAILIVKYGDEQIPGSPFRLECV